MRLFIAINFDEQIKQRLLAVQDRVREKAKQGKFPPPENFHLTLVFLGETPQERLSDIRGAMVQAASVDGKPESAFELVFSKTGFFKRGIKELWWLGMDIAESRGDGPARLEKLQKRLACELCTRNIFVDTKPFTPHITLGREIISDLWHFKTGSITIPVNRLSLMLSEKLPVAGKKTKLVYTELFKYDFGIMEDNIGL